jgi:hypothetical protein
MTADPTTTLPPPRAAAQQPDDAARQLPPAAVRAGLIPLPTPAQVKGAVPRGRRDPFASLPLALKPAAASPAAAAAVPSLSLLGVLAGGGQLQALVKTDAGSGAVCLGSRGRCLAGAEPLLPAGWTVQAIDLGRGCLTYSVGGKTQPPVCMT